MRLKFDISTLLQKVRLIVQGLMKAAAMVGGRKKFRNYDILETAIKWILDIYNIDWEPKVLGTTDKYSIIIMLHSSVGLMMT